MTLHSPRIRPVAAVLYRGGEALEREDLLAVEDPLEIRVRLADGPDAGERTLSMTMRTPGDDLELAVGFLCTEASSSAPTRSSTSSPIAATSASTSPPACACPRPPRAAASS